MYGFIIYAFNLQKNKYKIKYNGKEFPLEDKINIIEQTNEKYLEIDLLSVEGTKHFKILLSEDFENQIVLDLDESKNNKFNIELMTLCYYNNIDSNIILQKGEEKITLMFPQNDLRIGKINILNIDLNFKLFLKELAFKPIKNWSKFNYSSKDKIIYNKDINFNLLGKKTKNMSQFEERIREIPFEIDNNDIYGKELRFCFHVFENNHIMTIHNLEEIKENIDIEITSKEELEKLENKISEKIMMLKQQVKDLELDKINFEIIEDKYNDNIILYKCQNKEFEEKHFWAFIQYCYKYICFFIRNVIEKMIKNFRKEFDNYVDFGKNIIIEVLSKFECFNEYFKFIIEKKK